LFFYFRTWR